MKRFLVIIYLCLAASTMSACAIIPLVPFMGTAYGGYETWKGGKVTKFYAFDLDTVYLAAKQSCEQLKLETTIKDPVPQKEYSLETKGNYPMLIKVLLVEKNVTKVDIGVGFAGDKQYPEFFLKSIEDNILKMTAGK